MARPALQALESPTNARARHTSSHLPGTYLDGAAVFSRVSRQAAARVHGWVGHPQQLAKCDTAAGRLPLGKARGDPEGNVGSLAGQCRVRMQPSVGYLPAGRSARLWAADFAAASCRSRLTATTGQTGGGTRRRSRGGNTAAGYIWRKVRQTDGGRPGDRRGDGRRCRRPSGVTATRDGSDSSRYMRVAHTVLASGRFRFAPRSARIDPSASRGDSSGMGGEQGVGMGAPGEDGAGGGGEGELVPGRSYRCPYPHPLSWHPQMRIRGRDTISFVLPVVGYISFVNSLVQIIPS